MGKQCNYLLGVNGRYYAISLFHHVLNIFLCWVLIAASNSFHYSPVTSQYDSPHVPSPSTIIRRLKTGIYIIYINK